MTPRVVCLAVVAIVLTATGGCGKQSEAQVAVDRLATALSEPDAAALRELVGSPSTVGRTDLLTDELVADNAFAGHQVDVATDLDRFNGYGTFTLTSPEVPDTEVEVQQRLTGSRTPSGLGTVTIPLGRDVDTLVVNEHRVDISTGAREQTSDRTPVFYLPPGAWTFDLPPNPYADTEPQTVEVRDSRPGRTVALRAELNEDGRAEAVRRAEAYVAACGRATKSPRAGCGGGLTLCVGAVTTSRTTFSPTPRWSVDTARGNMLTHQPGLRRTVTTTCTDRDTGAVTERSTKPGAADLSGTVSITADGLDVVLR